MDAAPSQSAPEARSETPLPEPNRVGRPKDPLIVEEARRRLGAENAKANGPRRLAPFAREIHGWLREQPTAVRNSKGEVSSVETIEDHVRGMFNEFWSESKK